MNRTTFLLMIAGFGAFGLGAWLAATVWSESVVSPKDGYDEIDWDATARLICGADLETDNTVLLRTTVTG